LKIYSSSWESLCSNTLSRLTIKHGKKLKKTAYSATPTPLKSTLYQIKIQIGIRYFRSDLIQSDSNYTQSSRIRIRSCQFDLISIFSGLPNPEFIVLNFQFWDTNINFLIFKIYNFLQISTPTYYVKDFFEKY
jgi:hypothetical protein